MSRNSRGSQTQWSGQLNHNNKTVQIFDKTYEVESLPDQVKYLLDQKVDLTRKKERLKFEMEQLVAAEQSFTRRLVNEIEGVPDVTQNHKKVET